MSLQPIEIADGELSYDASFLCPTEADHFLERLQQNLQWRQDRITLFGREVKIPRLQAWYGDEEAHYRYSGLDLQPLPWIPELAELRYRIQQTTGYRFNGVLANLYRSGQDSVGWHSDNEPELGNNPVLATLTLGVARAFCLRHKKQRTLKLQLEPAHGSLLLMAGSTQHHWLHALPKRQLEGVRINLSFRLIRPLDDLPEKTAGDVQKH